MANCRAHDRRGRSRLGCQNDHLPAPQHPGDDNPVRRSQHGRCPDYPQRRRSTTDERDRRNHARGSEPRLAAGREGPERFCPVSLGDWLELCRQAGVPHVTAEKICELLREDCLSFDVPGERQERLRAAFQEMGKARLPGHMMRFDYCASLETKSSLSQGEWECRPEFCRVELDDPRAVDILFEYPRPQAPAWMRPWAHALVVDGCPVEYRAFIKGGGAWGSRAAAPRGRSRSSRSTWRQ